MSLFCYGDMDSGHALMINLYVDRSSYAFDKFRLVPISVLQTRLWNLSKKSVYFNTVSK